MESREPDISHDDRQIIALAIELTEDVEGAARRFAGVHSRLTQRLMARMRLTRAQAEEAAADALRALAEVAASGALDIPRAPALLTTLAHRKAIDLLRRPAEQSPPLILAADEPSTEDLVLALLERDADARAVRAGLRAAFDIDRGDIVHVVRIWLDLADARSGVPSLREVAAEAGVSHTQVRRLLAEFAELVPRPGPGT